MGNKSFKLHFDSVLAMSQFIETNQPAYEKSRQSGGSFTDCMSHKKTRKILAQGGHWSEGVERMQSARIDVTKIPLQESAIPVPVPAMVGHRPNVPAYLAGAPICMVRNTPESRPDRRVRMLVSIGGSAAVDHKALLRRGAAVMGAIQQLCNEGYAVELTVGFMITTNHTGKDGDQAYFTCKVKDFQDTFNPAALAFVLAEPSFFRRSMFSLFDISRVLDPDQPILKECAYNLGYPLTDFSRPEFADFDIIYESMHSGERWTVENSADKAMKKVYEWLEKTSKGAAA
jgi:hypothetical protein